MLAGSELLRRDMTIRLGGMIVVGAGLLFGLLRSLPPPPLKRLAREARRSLGMLGR